jgi:hypothetical protein
VVQIRELREPPGPPSRTVDWNSGWRSAGWVVNRILSGLLVGEHGDMVLRKIDD